MAVAYRIHLRRPIPEETAKEINVPYTVLRDAILTHPTMAEGLNALFASMTSEP
jgi:hypothetical protein